MTVVNPKSISGINSITTGSGSDNLLTIHTSDASSTERVRINSSGDVIVGSGITVSPDGDIFATGVTTATTFSGSGASLTNLNASNIGSGTVPTARLGSGTASSSTFLRGDSTFAAVTSTTINSNTNNYLITGTGTADTLQGESNLIFDGTQLGVNVSSPAYPLDVVGDGGGSFSASTNSTNGVLSIVGKNSSGSVSAISRIKSYPDGSSNQSHMTFETRNSSNTMVERLRIASDGDIGIGTITPQNNARLQVSTSNQVVAAFEGTGGSDPQIYLGDDMTTPTDNCIIIGYDKADNRGYLTVGGDGDNVFTVKNGGDIEIGVGNLKFGTSGKGIDFSATGDGTGSGSVSELLDDYEEGTWSPSGSWTTITASYTKIGRMVYAGFSLRANASSGNATIGNLPFTSGSTHAHGGGIAWGLCEFNSSGGMLNGSPGDNSTSISVKKNNAEQLTFGSGQNAMNNSAFIRGVVVYMTA